MTMNLAPEHTITSDAQLHRPDVPLVVEFTSSRVRQRPLAARMPGIELAAGRLPVRAVDIDARPDLRRRFKITLLPTFVVLYDSAELARFVGPHSRRELASAIRRALNPDMVRVDERPRARGLWNDFTTRLWGFSV
ncbi:MAG TPA: thioredoxin family protein [Dehalococcoidia bacterium]|nr:thioredoxin family protein [Dehalococcoidia bacterium]